MPNTQILHSSTQISESFKNEHQKNTLSKSETNRLATKEPHCKNIAHLYSLAARPRCIDMYQITNYSTGLQPGVNKNISLGYIKLKKQNIISS
jgi:hypothetical protein